MEVSSGTDHLLQRATDRLLYSQPHVLHQQIVSSLPRLEQLRDAPPYDVATKQNYYASPPSSPAQRLSPISLQAAQEAFRLGRGGMDGDDRHPRQYAPTGYQAPGSVNPVTARQSAGAQTERYQQAVQMQGRGDTANTMGRASTVPDYGGYGYSNQSAYSTPSLPTGSLQGSGMQYPSDFTQDSSRQQQQQQSHQQQSSTPTQAQQPQTQQQFPQYGSSVVYNIAQQAAPQSPYNAVQPYQQRPSAPIDVLSNQFGMQPYFGQNEPTSGGMSATHPSYITSQVDTASYTQQTPAPRAAVSQTYPMGVTEYETAATSSTVEQSETAQDPTYDEAYNQYQKALRETFEHTRAGRLIKASESLLTISGWLLGHAVELGLVRDNEALYDERLKMWNEFNYCWLGVAQKQKDLIEDMMQTGRQPRELLSAEMIEKLCDEVVNLSDKMEPHGLVDYQMGFWEEEIISVLMQCLDLTQAVERESQTQAGPSAPRQ